MKLSIAPVRFCGWLLLPLAAAAISCGATPTAPAQSADFRFTGTVTRSNQMFHEFTTPRSGTLTASILWSAAEPSQTVCVGRAGVADFPATCATASAGTMNTVSLPVEAGVRFLAYAVPSYQNAEA